MNTYIKFIACSLQPWRFETKITSEKIRFKAGSLPRMINKEWLPNLYINLPNEQKNWQLKMVMKNLAMKKLAILFSRPELRHIYMRDCSHYETRENKPHLSCGFP